MEMREAVINASDVHKAIFQAPLAEGGTSYGTTYTTYDVRQVTDVRNLSEERTYVVTCAQRVVIPNPTVFDLTPGSENGFSEYPALLSSQFQIIGTSDYAARLLTYAPRTLNTTIMATSNESQGKNQSFTRQHTAGSSVSQTNTYGGSVSLGFSGEDPTGSVSEEFSHSDTVEHSTSDTTGSDQGASSERGATDAMSIKDWGAYAYLDAANLVPTWLWGQEYPWDVIQYRYCPKDNQVELPEFVLCRLFDDATAPTQAFPPSQLSLFGIDFTMKAAWQVTLPADLSKQSLALEHRLAYVSASHGLEEGAPVVTLNPTPVPFEIKPSPLDLTLLGLDPVQLPGPVIGFIPDKFIVPPAAGEPFKIIADTNTMQVTGKGFDSAMSTSFADGSATVLVQFKILDAVTEYGLFLKHWKTTENGCSLSMVFNGDTANPVIRHVDTMESEGGDENLTSVILRNTDYAAADYHDYLVMGLNSVEITITPDDPAQPAGYLLRAIALGER